MQDRRRDFVFIFKGGVENDAYSFGHVDLGLCIEMSSRIEIWTTDRNLRIKGKNKNKDLKAVD